MNTPAIATQEVQELHLATHSRLRSKLTMSGRRKAAFRVKGAASLLISAAVSSNAYSQGITCGVAVAQLQNYVAQVNAFANAEYFQNIPARCGPNIACGQWWLGQLNNWYMQQTQLVNGWYQRISMQCSQGTQQQQPPPLHTQSQTQSQPGQIDPDSVENIDVDDQDKTVAIHIPSNPKGYN